MRRTRLFHTVVIVGSSLLANCEKAPATKKDATVKDAAVVKDAPPIVLIDAPVPAQPQIMVAPPPPVVQIRAIPKRSPKGPPKGPLIL